MFTNDDFLSFAYPRKNFQTSFLKFDIVSFYPSISQDLFEKAIEWAKIFF